MSKDIVQRLRNKYPSNEFIANLTNESIDAYRKTHTERIERFRAAYIENLSQIPVSLKYYRLEVLDFLISDLRDNKNLWQLDDKGKKVGSHAVIGQLLGLARQEMTEVVADAKDNIYINNQIKQYFIATGEQITAEQAMELTPKDWKELHEPVEKQKKALPSGEDSKAQDVSASEPKDGSKVEAKNASKGGIGDSKA